jgi:hypothetical protein
VVHGAARDQHLVGHQRRAVFADGVAAVAGGRLRPGSAIRTEQTRPGRHSCAAQPPQGNIKASHENYSFGAAAPPAKGKAQGSQVGGPVRACMACSAAGPAG